MPFRRSLSEAQVRDGETGNKKGSAEMVADATFTVDT